MILKYGGYTHADDECTVSVESGSIYSTRLARHITKIVMSVDGRIHAANVGALTAAINTMESAYSVDNRDLILYENDGTTRTAHKLLTGTALGGVRITNPPSFSEVVKGEYTTWRNYHFEAEADYLALRENTLAFKETISSTGTGGPRYVYLEVIQGQPQKQLVANSTVASMVQSGSALGVLGYPNVPTPIFSGDEDVVERNVTRVGPMRLLGVSTEFGVSWTFRMRRAGGSLIAIPTIR